jgi:hypothetical protein
MLEQILEHSTSTSETHSLVATRADELQTANLFAG